MNFAQKQTKVIDLVAYAANDNREPVLVPSILNYNPSFVKVKSSLSDKFNFIDSGSALGKSLIDDKRVKKIDDLFPSALELYGVQKDLMVPVYVMADEDKGNNVVNLPVVVHPKRPVEVIPSDDEKVVPLRKEEGGQGPKKYLVQPVQYGYWKPVSFYENLGGRVISNLEAKLSHYGKANFSKESMYYRR